MTETEERCRVCRCILGPDDEVRVLDGRVVCERCAGPRHPPGCSCGDPDCPEWPYREVGQ